MSISQISKVWDYEFSHAEQSTMLALAAISDEHGRSQASLVRIAWETGYDERSIRRTLNELKRKGIVVVEKPHTNKEPAVVIFDWTSAKKKPTFEDHAESIASNPSKRDYKYLRHGEFVFDRDGNKCVYCLSVKSLTLDHIVARSKGGSDEPENLACCCASCNSSKGTKSVEEWRAWR